jgi:hypothetical protein
MVCDLRRMYEVLRELEAFVLADPRLAEFVAPVRELCAQAKALRDGATEISPLSAGVPRTIPDRNVAIELVRILSRFPSVDPELATPEQLRPIASLLANVERVIVRPMWSTFPDVIPREPADS